MEISVVYGVVAIISLLLIIGYFKLIKEKQIWFIMLYASVFVVNSGYFLMSLSNTLGEALMANRVAYLGSVFLPLCMLMIIMDVCKVTYHRCIKYILFAVSIIVFIIAASGGYTDWYYKEVTIAFVSGAATLVKVYGPLHGIYYIYLFVYMIIMTSIILVAYKRKKTFDPKHAALMLSAVFGNMFIWFIEQKIDTGFEFLSISYILTELILLFLCGMLQDYAYMKEEQISDPIMLAAAHPELAVLTEREKEVVILILQDKKRKEIADELSVTEHTIKKHTAHIFAKLEVTNRTELHEKLGIK